MTKKKVNSEKLLFEAGVQYNMTVAAGNTMRVQELLFSGLRLSDYLATELVSEGLRRVVKEAKLSISFWVSSVSKYTPMLFHAYIGKAKSDITLTGSDGTSPNLIANINALGDREIDWEQILVKRIMPHATPYTDVPALHYQHSSVHNGIDITNPVRRWLNEYNDLSTEDEFDLFVFVILQGSASSELNISPALEITFDTLTRQSRL